MNYLFFATSNYKPESGGIAELGHKLAYTLTKHGHTVTVLAEYNENAHDFDKNQVYRIIRIKKNNLFKYLNIYFSENNIDIIFILSIGSNSLTALYFGKRYKIPVSLYIHGLEITKFKGSLITIKLKKIIKKYVLNTCDYILCNSFNTLKLILKYNISSEKINILHPGIDTSISKYNIDNIKDKILNINSDTFVFLTLGRLIERKGIDTVIKALPHVINFEKKIKYLIAGPVEDKYKNELIKLINNLHVSSYVEFLGYINDDEKSYLLSRQNCFIMPSRELPNGDVEGFGIVFLEAALYGKPVIAGASGGIPDAVVHNQTGLLVDPYSPTAVANMMIMLLQDSSLCKSMEIKGRQRAISYFNWDRQAELFNSLFCNDKTVSQKLGKTFDKNYDILNTLPLKNPIDKQAAYENLYILKEVLDFASIPFFIFFGTLLGALRENDFISHDYDTDIVILEPYKNLFLSIVPELEQKGLIFVRTAKNDRVLSFYRNEAYLDIYFAKLTRIGITKKWYIDYSTVKKNYLLNYKKVIFKDIELTIPEKSENILRRFYGRNWHIPKKDYEANPDYFMKIVRFLKRPNKLDSFKRFKKWLKKR